MIYRVESGLGRRDRDSVTISGLCARDHSSFPRYITNKQLPTLPAGRARTHPHPFHITDWPGARPQPHFANESPPRRINLHLKIDSSPKPELKKNNKKPPPQSPPPPRPRHQLLMRYENCVLIVFFSERLMTFRTWLFAFFPPDPSSSPRPIQSSRHDPRLVSFQRLMHLAR